MNTIRYTLNIEADESVRDLYLKHSTYHVGDAGLDLFVPEIINIQPGQTTTIDHKIKCEMIEHLSDGTTKNVSYFLYPRSSISNTPLRMANSVGIIDSGYRGNILSKVTYIITDSIFKKILGRISNTECDYKRNDLEPDEQLVALNNSSYSIEKNSRLFQICAPSLESFNVVLVDSLSKTDRGTGGFGSTGK